MMNLGLTIKYVSGGSLRWIAKFLHAAENACFNFRVDYMYDSLHFRLCNALDSLSYRLNHLADVLDGKGNLLQNPPPVYRPGIVRREEDFAVDFCENCDAHRVIYAVGITACPVCGKPLYPCSKCVQREKCFGYYCIYGSPSVHLPELNAKKASNPPITEDEVRWFQETSSYSEQVKNVPWWRGGLPF